MLVLLPPSEGKTAPTGTDVSSKLDLQRIAPFSAELSTARESVLTALEKISATPDALQLLGVGPRLADEVNANTSLRVSPTAPAYEVYSGVLFESGQFNSRGRRYVPSVDFQVLVQSALFGLVDLASPIPAYRLSMDTKLGDLGALATFWKTQLTPLLAEVSNHQVLVDCRSGSYIKAWPALESKVSAYRLFRVNVVRLRDGKRTVVSHNAKKYRGVLAGMLLEAASSGKLVDSVSSLEETTGSLVGQNDVVEVEFTEKKNYTELIIVTV